MEIVIILSTIIKLSKKIFQYGTALILPESLVQDDYRINKLYFDSWHHDKATEVAFSNVRKLKKTAILPWNELRYSVWNWKKLITTIRKEGVQESMASDIFMVSNALSKTIKTVPGYLLQSENFIR